MIMRLLSLLTIFISSIGFSQTVYNFESGNLDGWLQVPNSRWQASSTTPLNGGYSLKHTFNNTTIGTDRISIALPSWNLSSGDIKWQVKVRHGYDPSSSNRWWIYLMSDKDANQMQLGGLTSGYAVGVNLTSTGDDLLKLWRIDYGIPQSIITTTLDWQNLISTSGVGAIEVERKMDGTFTLKAATNGSFSSLTSYGSALDITHQDFSYFGIGYNYSSTADMLLWVDDISLYYTPLNKNNITSEVLSPSSQVAPSNISSTSNNPTSAFDVIKFKIKDNGSGDNLPTKVKSIVFKKGTSTNAANWISTIGGVKLKDESGEIQILNQSVSADKISLTVDSTMLSVPDGQTKEYTLSLYLKSNGLEDGTTLKLYIDSVKHGFEAGLSGSDFVNTFSNKIISSEVKIDVVATNLKFTQQPSGISKNKPFALSVGGVDALGNTDKEFSNAITLALSQGSGILSSSSSLTKTPTAGISTWSDLLYNAYGTLKILATSSGISQVETSTINVLNDSSSVVVAAASQPTAAGISSLKTYLASAVEVLRFRVQDTGESDGLPTNVSSIKISRVEMTDAASLLKAIGGILVKVNGNPVSISDPDIKTSYFTFNVSNNAIVAPDGGFADVSIFIYLNNGGLTDNQKIQLKVNSTNHGFTAYPSGSKFNSTFLQEVLSNIFWIDVVATQQKFASIPTRVGVLLPFSVTLNATDANGNTDKDFSGTETLSLLTGNGNLGIPSGATQPITQGVCTFNMLTYTKPEKFSLLASCSTLNNIASPLITCGDSDGGVIIASTSSSPVIVSSISINSQSATEVLKVKVYDAGSTDGLPLFPTKINLFCFDPTKSQQLFNQIGGFVIRTDNVPIDIEYFALNAGVIEITPKLGSIIIADKDTVDLSISLYLKAGAITDAFPFRFYIPSTNHGWQSSAEGTGFASAFNAAIYGPECSINVDATKLKFVSTPFIAVPSQQFSIKVCATDAFGNIDYDCSNSVTLALDYGTGTMSCSNPTQTITSGFANWNDVTLNKIGAYRFKASENGLGTVTSDELICGIAKNCLVDENFESTINTSWLASDWLLSTISPINGAKSLQHKQNASSGINTLSIPATFPSIGDKATEWNLTLRNGDWDPSTDNYFYFALMANTQDLNADGYFIGINPSSGNDYLTLWCNNQGVKKPIITSSFDWNTSDEVKIKVGLSTKGEWQFWYQPKSEQSFILAGKGNSISNTSMNRSGLFFEYTSSRSGQLWMDDLSICATDYPPILLSAKPLNLNTVKVLFSERINLNDASAKANYSIIDKTGASIEINSISTSTELPNGAYLKTEQLPIGKLLLKVEKISDLNDNSIKDSIYFGLSEKGSLGRLIINEIMANPEPSVGLPKYEYIELYNPTSETIHLNGWKLELNDYKLTLPNDSILSNQYIVLCSTSTAPALSAFGKSIGVTNFPSLLNSGMNISLTDASGSFIAMANYSEDWYGDEMKKQGGWSLEKIDYRNLMEGKSNWKASNDSKGGTPFVANSVVNENPDITSPMLLFAEILDNKTIKLLFSEPMDSLMLTFTNNFDIDNGIGHPESATLIGIEYNTAIISLPNSLNIGTIYNLCLSQNITDFSGNHLIDDCVRIALPQTAEWNDIVINEVIFNPNAGGVDFVELYNKSDKTFELKNFSLANRNSTTKQLDQVYSASDTSRLLFPNEYAVISINAQMVKQFYRTENDKAFINVSSMPSFNNDEGYVVLLDKKLEAIDELHYKESMHSKLLNDFKGVSLERINPNLSSSSSSTWQSAAQTAGFATPTYKNSQWVEPSAKDDAFTLAPETFSPDGDGRDDYLLISYKLPNEGNTTNIRVFSSNGTEVKRLASNLLIGTKGTLTWDGLNNQNQRVPMGIYIVYIEYFNPGGEVKKIKKTCVVAEKL